MAEKKPAKVYIGRKLRMICHDPEQNAWRHPLPSDPPGAGIEGEVVADVGEFAHVLVERPFQVKVPVKGGEEGEFELVERTEAVRVAVRKDYLDQLPEPAAAPEPRDESTAGPSQSEIGEESL